MRVLLVGDQRQIDQQLDQIADQGTDPVSRVSILHTNEAVDDRDKPESVLRGNRQSSMFLAVNSVREGRADACVSAGNTGALLMAGRHLLKTVPGINKPAIVAALPVRQPERRCLVLDVGANIECDAGQLCQQALMGSILASAVHGIRRPRVGLLNIGAEDYKGTEAIHKAAAIVATWDNIEYLGYIEANRIFSGDIDVLVCDGFAGNITIKAGAGVVSMVEHMIADVRAQHPELAGKVDLLFEAITRELDPARYNGANLLGLNGVIVKSHGNANAQGFYCAIEQALAAVQQQLPALIAQRVQQAGGLRAATDGV